MRQRCRRDRIWGIERVRTMLGVWPCDGGCLSFPLRGEPWGSRLLGKDTELSHHMARA